MAPPVLVVENDPAIRQMLEWALDLEGYPVRAAADGATGLDLLRASPEPHVVLVNYLMPDLDGFAVLAAAVAEPALCRHRYVLMSSCESCHREPRACVPHELLPKPFTMERLLSSVESAADGLREEIPGVGMRIEGETIGALPLLLTFTPQSAISRRRGRIVVRTRAGATVALTVRDEAGRELWRPELSSVRVADESGYCRWHWIHRARGGELTVEANAEWRGQSANVSRAFSLGQPWRGGR